MMHPHHAIPAIALLLVALPLTLALAGATATQAGRPAPPAICQPTATVAQVDPGADTCANFIDAVDAGPDGALWAAGGTVCGSYPNLVGAGAVWHWTGASWAYSMLPVGVTSYFANGIKAFSANEVWVVGWDMHETWDALAWRWDGTQWLLSRPQTTGDPELNAVDGVAPDDLWAVGYYFDTPGHWVPLIRHWTGAAWDAVAAPPVDGQGTLYAVSARASNDVWAVGDETFPDQGYRKQALALHWDGTSWTRSALPDLGSGSHALLGVQAVSATEVWAVGYVGAGSNTQTLALHWAGGAWAQVSSPNPAPAYNTFQAIAGTSASDVWAAGTSGTTPDKRTLLAHWNGTAWSQVDSPNPGYTDHKLAGITAASPVDVWAVGSYWVSRSGTMYEVPLAERFTGGCGGATPGPTTTTPPGATVTPRPGATITPRPPTHTVVPPTVTLPPGQHFGDVPPANPFYVPINWCFEHGIISGYADGTFRPYANTTRGQLAKMIVVGEGWPIDTSGGPHFGDVPPSHPFYGVIETAFHHGVISGYGDGTFRWGNDVTRGQIAKIVVVAEGWAIDTRGGPHFTDVPPSNPFYAFIETAYHRSIISGYGEGTFRWGSNATRGQIAKILYNTLTAAEPPTETPVRPTVTRVPPSATRPPPSATRTAPPTVVVPTNTPCTGGNLIQNGGFETGGFGGWTLDGYANAPLIVTGGAHSGTYAGYAGNRPGVTPEPDGDSSFYQQVTVPAGGGTLSFWYWPYTVDTIYYDWQDVYVTNTSGQVLATVLHVAEDDRVWKPVSYDMAAYAGQTVRIKFLVHQDAASDPTGMAIDDVSLASSGCAGRP